MTLAPIIYRPTGIRWVMINVVLAALAFQHIFTGTQFTTGQLGSPGLFFFSAPPQCEIKPTISELKGECTPKSYDKNTEKDSFPTF